MICDLIHWLLIFLIMWLQYFFTLGNVLPFKHWETMIKQVLLSVQHHVSLERFGIQNGFGNDHCVSQFQLLDDKWKESIFKGTLWKLCKKLTRNSIKMMFLAKEKTFVVSWTKPVVSTKCIFSVIYILLDSFDISNYAISHNDELFTPWIIFWGCLWIISPLSKKKGAVYLSILQWEHVNH